MTVKETVVVVIVVSISGNRKKYQLQGQPQWNGTTYYLWYYHSYCRDICHHWLVIKYSAQIDRIF